MKDYKEKYEQLAQFIKDIYPFMPDYCKEKVEGMIPELKESEGDRIRKNCIHFLELQKTHHAATFEIDECIAWLEKQCEQKPIISDDAIREGVAHFGITQYQITNWLKKYINVVNQTSVKWSEDDERILDSIIEEVMPCGECPDYPTDEEREYFYEGNRKVEWLKSLKERYTWKPSDEQMEALKDAVRLYKSTHFDSQHYKIETLYEGLKKLKGE